MLPAIDSAVHSHKFNREMIGPSKSLAMTTSDFTKDLGKRPFTPSVALAASSPLGDFEAIL